jgi:hypothetical protein
VDAVEDRVGGGAVLARQGGAEGGRVARVSAHQAGAGLHVGAAPQHRDVVAVGEEVAGQLGADLAGTGDEETHGRLLL